MKLKQDLVVDFKSEPRSSPYNWNEWLDGSLQAIVEGSDFPAGKEAGFRYMALMNAKKRGIQVKFKAFVDGKFAGEKDFLDESLAGKNGVVLQSYGTPDLAAAKIYCDFLKKKSQDWMKMKKELDIYLEKAVDDWSKAQPTLPTDAERKAYSDKLEEAWKADRKKKAEANGTATEEEPTDEEMEGSETHEETLQEALKKEEKHGKSKKGK